MSHIIKAQGNPDTFGCVHAAGDGKLSNHNVTTRFPVEAKKEIISSFLKVIMERANPEIRNYGMQGVSLVLHDTGRGPNYQGADGILADDVLIEIILILNKSTDVEVIDTAINHICEQMSDMLRTNGTCPSGRVNRLFSILVYLRDYYMKHINDK